jgi:hypothetical protein
MKRLLWLAACLLGVAGCATAPPAQVLPGADTGLVYANLPGRDAPDSITVQSLDRSTIYQLHIVRDGAARLVESWLPSGDYKLAEWESLPFGDYESFHVEAGRMTDLGSLVRVPIGDYKFVVLPLRPAAGDASPRRVQDEFVSNLHGEALEWRPSVPPPPIAERSEPNRLGLIASLIDAYQRKLNKAPLRQQLAESKSSLAFFNIAKATVPPVTQTALVSAQGNLLYGADLGQIRVRHPNGVWTSMDTGLLASVTSLARRGNLLVAGYDNGLIRTSSDGGMTWINAGTIPGGDSIIDISWSGKRWLATTSSRANIVSVYATAGDSLVHFDSIHKMNAQWGLHNQGRLSRDGYYVIADPALYRLDLESMRWSKLQTPADVSGFSLSADGKLLTIFWAKGVFSKLYVSSDKGISWKQYKAPPLVIDDVKFSDLAHGIAVRVRPNVLTASVILMRYDPGTDSWAALSQPPDECEHMIDNASGMPEFCVTRGGAVLSQISGKWAVESAAY